MKKSKQKTFNSNLVNWYIFHKTRQVSKYSIKEKI
nr:MAG TPA: hypothetical protein [Caudoviricetes sp.]